MTVATSYSLRDVPASGTDRSRFLLASSQRGTPIHPALNVVSAYGTLLGELEDAMEERRPPLVTVRLKGVRLVDGEWVLAERGSITRAPVYSGERPGKLWKRLQGAPLLDDFFVRGEAWTLASDGEVWQALLETVKSHGYAQGVGLLNDIVARALCLRAGIPVAPYELPSFGA